MSRKVFVIGLDCLDPSLVFDRWTDALPNMASIIKGGFSARLRSTDPPITIPAWISMLSGVSPGELGIYGFRNRENYTKTDLSVLDSRQVRYQRIWDILSENGKQSVSIGVPPTYPVSPMLGYMVSGILTPNPAAPQTYPKNLYQHLLNVSPQYQTDITEFRKQNRDDLIRDIYQVTEARFKWIRHMIQYYRWQFFIFVEMGIDRMQHAFWQFQANDSPYYQEDNPYRHTIYEYYRYIDQQIGRLLKQMDDETDVVLVSDHGAKTMQGGVAINQWFIENGLLALKNKPESVHCLTHEMIDWQNTIAWGEGGYYGRIFLNIRNREFNGTVAEDQVPHVINEIKDKLSRLTTEEGNVLNNQIFTPEELYSTVHGYPPDLMIYFDDLNYRAISQVGTQSVVSRETFGAPDGANHSFHGVFAIKGQHIKPQHVKEINILDVAPLILHRMQIKQPAVMQRSAFEL
ncbi:MAG: phosphodiesterase [Caldithrix sp.]|nr:phosphodiesterase [Caldithrix sp.]